MLIQFSGLVHSQNECYFASGRIVGAGSGMATARIEMPYLLSSLSTTATTLPADGNGSDKTTSLLQIQQQQPMQQQQQKNADTTAANDGSYANISNSSSSSTGADIQQHLQCMFDLLRKEETLKMAVKLETARTGRTRYLVVVTRPATCHVQQQQQQQQQDVISTVDGNNTSSSVNVHKTSEHLCEASPLCNNSEESCLLGIDCNEKTTVGLVLRILADTTIRMDGDGYDDFFVVVVLLIFCVCMLSVVCCLVALRFLIFPVVACNQKKNLLSKCTL